MLIDVSISYLYTAIEIGFTRQRIYLTEQFGSFENVINKSRVSEQTFLIQIETTTLLSNVGERAILGWDVDFGTYRRFLYFPMCPLESSIYISYNIIGDNTPENQEVFQLSVTPAIDSPDFGCSVTNGCYQQIEIVIIDDDGE